MSAATPAVEIETPSAGPVRRAAVVQNPQGLHMRPASRTVEIARGFASVLTLRCGEKAANARSLMELLLLGVEPGGELTVEADGPDAAAAADALAVYLGAADWDS